MAPRPAAAALVLAAFLPSTAPAVTVEDFVDTFEAGCLAHLPDFAGSPAAFQKLGFSQTGSRFTRRHDGSTIMAEIYERTVDAGQGCVVAARMEAQAEVAPAVEALVTDLSENQFKRREARREGRRVEAFSWQSGGWEVLVVILPRVGDMQALNVTVGEAQ